MSRTITNAFYSYRSGDDVRFPTREDKERGPRRGGQEVRVGRCQEIP